MGKKRKTQNQKEKRAKKRRDKEQWEATPILEKAGMVSFKSAGTVVRYCDDHLVRIPHGTI